MDQDKINETTQARLDATIERLIFNIAAACQVLDEQGYVSLMNQLQSDRANLRWWQAQGRLVFEAGA